MFTLQHGWSFEMRTEYDKWVAMAVPDSKVDAANEMAASITGNQADLQTFVRRAFATNGAIFYVTLVPMRESVFELMPTLQSTMEGTYDVIKLRTNHEWMTIKTFEEWLMQVGLVLEEWEYEFDAIDD